MTHGRDIAMQVADDLVADGAVAVVLGGSVVRGDEHAHSDIDICAIASNNDDRFEDRDEYSLRIVADRLVSVSWRTGDGVRALMDAPSDAGGAVPAWRNAEILAEEALSATLLQRFAHEWRWARIDDACDEWVASNFVGYAEEVYRLAGLDAAGRNIAAAAIRSVLALRLPHILAVRRRIFYDSENALWELVAEAVGRDWSEAHSQALGIGAAPDAAVRAALRLWVLAADEISSLLDDDARTVVDAAVAVAAAPR
jgi:hypothetical protein